MSKIVFATMGDYSEKMRGQVTAVVSAALQSTTLPAAGCGSLKTAESSVAVGPKYFPMDANAVTALDVYRKLFWREISVVAIEPLLFHLKVGEVERRRWRRRRRDAETE
jgi:hypothetical protein